MLLLVLFVMACSIFLFQEILPGLFLGPYSAAMKSKVIFPEFNHWCLKTYYAHIFAAHFPFLLSLFSCQFLKDRA